MRDRHRARISPKLCFPLVKKNGSGTEEKRMKEREGEREREGESEGWREKEQRKMFPPSSTNLWMNNSISFQWSPRALVPSVHTNPVCTPASCILSRICASKAVQRSRDSCVHPTADTMNYRCTLNIVLAGNAVRSPPFFTPFLPRPTPLFESPTGKTLVDFAISDSGCISVRFELPIR